MSPPDCDHFRGLIALAVLGRLPETELVGLAAHLDGCRDCREDQLGLMELSAVLPAAELARLDEVQMPPGLSVAVLSRLDTEARRARRRRGSRWVLGAAAAAAVVILGLALSLSGGGSSVAGRTVALTGQPEVHASVRLTSEAWGTALHIEESGQVGGQVMWVSMRTTSGKWWEAGTYRPVTGHLVQVDLACALGLSRIESVWILNSAGHVVLHAYLG